MSDFIKKLVDNLEPTIKDLEANLSEFETNNQELSKIVHMLDYINGDMKKIGNYQEQGIILENLKILNSNENEYKANCYLLSSDDENVKTLPQYNKAKSYFEKFIACFKMRKEELTIKVSELEKICNEKKLNKKYLSIFKKDNPVVWDVDEFNDFLAKQLIDDTDKIKILLNVIKNNVNNYKDERIRGR